MPKSSYEKSIDEVLTGARTLAQLFDEQQSYVDNGDDPRETCLEVALRIWHTCQGSEERERLNKAQAAMMAMFGQHHQGVTPTSPERTES